MASVAKETERYRNFSLRVLDLHLPYTVCVFYDERDCRIHFMNVSGTAVYDGRLPWITADGV